LVGFHSFPSKISLVPLPKAPVLRQRPSLAVNIFGLLAFALVLYVAGFYFLPVPMFSHRAFTPLELAVSQFHSAVFYPARLLETRVRAPQRQTFKFRRVKTAPPDPARKLVVEYTGPGVLPGREVLIPVEPAWEPMVAGLNDGDTIEGTYILEPYVSSQLMDLKFVSFRKVAPPTSAPPAPPHPSTR
jgi:hypothetical protein